MAPTQKHPRLIAEFERRLRHARREVWSTVVTTDDELTTLESHQAGALVEDAANEAVTSILAQLDGRARHHLDEVDAAQARLAAGTFGCCEGCGKPIVLARLRAIPTARFCITCEHSLEHVSPR